MCFLAAKEKFLHRFFSVGKSQYYTVRLMSRLADIFPISRDLDREIYSGEHIKNRGNTIKSNKSDERGLNENLQHLCVRF
jgi:hypothetical protein